MDGKHLNKRNVSKDIINAIDILHKQNPEKRSNSGETAINPVSDLITPEWHYSNSKRILDEIDLKYESVLKSDLTQLMATELGAIEFSDYVNTGFERDFCCWYQPYHYLPREKWGIHIRKDSWMDVSSLFFNTVPGLVDKNIDSVTSAFFYFIVHGLFHYIIEHAASTMELLMDKPCLYTDYYTKIYSEDFNTSNCLEEALCNSYLYNSARQFNINSKSLKTLLIKQGPGYNDFVKYLGKSFCNGIRIILSQIKFCKSTPFRIDPIESLINEYDPGYYLSSGNIPIWLHERAQIVH